MSNIAINDMFHPHFPVKVNDIEIRNGKTIPTYYLMKQLSEMHKNDSGKINECYNVE